MTQNGQKWVNLTPKYYYDPEVSYLDQHVGLSLPGSGLLGLKKTYLDQKVVYLEQEVSYHDPEVGYINQEVRYP